MKKDIEQFFNDVKYILNPKKEVKQRTNVIYLTTDCNLKCTYCYEEKSRNTLNNSNLCTVEDIDDFLKEICVREREKTSTIVIMGGEPLLTFDLVQYTILSCMRIPNKGFGISLVTNATLLTDSKIKILKSLMEKGKDFNVNISLEISYDGSGQKNRIFKNGKSTKELIEQKLKKLEEYNIPFKISYTVHDGNYNNVLEDVITILETIKCYRITIGYAYQILDEKLNEINVGKNLKRKLIPYFNILFDKYKIPICGHTCGVCRICDKSFEGNSYLSPTTGITYDKKKTEHEFRQF